MPVSAPDLDRFLPRELADKLEAARTSGTMVGERRVLTILFCDIQGSTAAAEKLDPEEWTEIINGAFEYMIKPVYKYEGTVARLMGDAILAFFGAPIAHEDDPQRAVLSGLEIVAGFKTYQEQTLARYGFSISARVGINTGLVVVGAVGSDLRMEYTAMGDAVNLAARMEQTAEPNTVQIADQTYQLIEPLFDLQALGAVEVKGKAEPVLAHRVIGRKAIQKNLRGIEGMRAPLIGRDRELNTLKEILDRSQQGLGHIVCLTGEAGLGKSRLIEEAHDYWQAAGYSGRWQAVSSYSYETNHAYGLIQRLVRRLNQIAVVDSPAILRQKLEPLLNAFPAERRPQFMPVFEALFAIESSADLPRLEGETFRQELFNMMLQIWSRQFADQPTVFIFDDLHWSDPASVQLLTHLLSATDSIPLVLICAFRPDPQAPSAALQSTAKQNFTHRYTEIQLAALPAADINAILDEMLATSDLPPELRQNILDRAGGNPFFVEEVVRSLVLSGAVIAEDKLVGGEMQHQWRAVDGAAAPKIPDNLQGLLAARIDKLDENIRSTLQLASVIGRSFYERVLLQMAENSNGSSPHTNQNLRRLLQLQMIVEAARIPEVEYIFRNPLTQEVAYNGILLKRRREFHNWVGLAMETLYADQLTEISPRLAFHFQEAGELKKAFHYFLMAGDQARHFYAHQEALAHYEQALAVIDEAHPDSDQLIHLFLDRGRVLEHSAKFREALENYEVLGNQGQKQDNKEMELQALIAMGILHTMFTPLQDHDRAEQLALQSLVLAQELENKAAEAKIHWLRMQIARMRGREGDTKNAIKFGEQSLDLSRDLNLRTQMSLTLNDLAALYRYAGAIDKSNESSHEAREIFRELGNRAMLADSYGQKAHFHSLSGELDEAEKAARETNRISREIGNLWNLGISAFVTALVEMERGHLAGALSVSYENLEMLDNSGHAFMINVGNFRIVEALAEAGAWEKALSIGEKSLNTEPNSTLLTAPKRALLNRIQLLIDPNFAQKEALDQEPLKGTESLLMGYYALYQGQYQAELGLAQGNPAFAEQKGREAIAIAESFDIGIFLPVLRLLLAKALWQQDEKTAAQQSLAEAENKARAIGSRRSLWPILAQKADWEKDALVAKGLHDEAITIITYISDHAGELKQSFLNRPDVKAVFS